MHLRHASDKVSTGELTEFAPANICHLRAVSAIAAVDEDFQRIAGAFRITARVSIWNQVPWAITFALRVYLFGSVAFVTRWWIRNTAFINAMVAARARRLGLEGRN